MWQRFTERARRVVFFAQEEAGRLGENYVSTEHLLLGLLREEDTAGAQVLAQLGVSLEALRSEIKSQVVNHGSRVVADMQLSPRGRRAVDLAYEEARSINNNYIGTEHLLLGLLREREGMAARVLMAAGVELEAARQSARALQAHQGATAQQPDSPSPRPAEPPPSGGLERLQARPGIGDLGTLQGASPSAPVSIAVDEAAFAEMIAVLSARDHHGYRELLDQEKMTLVRSGTEAKLLRPERGEAYFVRILSGEREGQTGWVLRSHFQYVGPDTRPFPPEVE